MYRLMENRRLKGIIRGAYPYPVLPEEQLDRIVVMDKGGDGSVISQLKGSGGRLRAFVSGKVSFDPDAFYKGLLERYIALDTSEASAVNGLYRDLRDAIHFLGAFGRGAHLHGDIRLTERIQNGVVALHGPFLDLQRRCVANSSCEYRKQTGARGVNVY